jgi:sugar phosphate isomerase/epimerase
MTLEPLNRYETNFINTLDEGIKFIKKIGLQNVKILADIFHMNIEEVSISKAIIEAKNYISHVHFADSNRCAPGDGHLNFREIVSSLVRINYNGFVAMEMLPKPDSLTVANRAISYLKELNM